MKNLLALLLVLLASGETVVAQNLSNRGKEFWVGYGHHQFMEPAQNNSQEMVLYFSAEQPANVRVTINGTAYVRDYAVPANSVIASELIPKNGTNDCRLYSVPPSFGGTGGEGVFNRGIHIISDVPIVAYAHIYGSASSGATMLMPVETWGYSYATINSQQRFGNFNCFSWVYVVANEDNTVIEVTPSVTTRNGQNPGVPFTATLNKGQIYQVIGAAINASTGYELTGTKVKSIANAAGECYPIGVFAGSSRTYITCSGTGGAGGDNIMQQIFPFQAWGKRYLTAPTSSANGASSLHTNIYRVAVKDPTAIVKRNGVPLTGLRNNFYYEFISGTADYIESDKPILVAQYMSSNGGCPNTGGDGDPEMMYISPIEQAIKRVGFYRNDEERINTNYLTLIIPNAGVSSLRIDGSPAFSHTYPHPNLPGYTVVIKRWTATKAQCIVQSDSAFTAITYGLGNVESYGYNAGTLINNLNAISAVRNVLDVTSSEHKFTCTNTPAELSVLLAYQPTRLQWLFSELGNSIVPNTNVVDNAPISTGTTTVNGITYYKYTLPGTYTFSSIDTFRISILATHPSVENCNNTERLTIEVIVKEKPKADFSISHLGCTLDTVYLSGSNTTTNNFTLSQWKWDFPGSITQNGQVVKHLLPPGDQNIKLTVVSSDGCISDTTKQIKVLDKPSAAFSVSPLTGCEGTVMTFTDTATNSNSNPVNAWYWDFGNSTNATPTSSTPQAVTYAAPGDYLVKHVVKTSATCVSDTIKTTVTVSPRPAKPVATSAVTFCQNGMASPLSATALAGHSLTWYIAFPLAGGTSAAPTPSTAVAGTFTYYVTQTNGTTNCISDTSQITVTITPVITANTVSADQTVCAGTAAAPLTGPGIAGGTGTYSYQWQSSTDGVNWTNIAGATDAAYDPGVLPSGITKFRRVVNSGLCNSASNVVSVTAETSLSNYEISGAQTVCEGVVPSELIGQSPSGGTGNYTYEWAMSTNGGNWAAIPGATGKDYQPTALTKNTYFRRITFGGNCPATSAPVLISVNPLPNGSITAPAGICSYETADVVFSSSAGTAPYTIQLSVRAPGGGTSTINRTINTSSPAPINVIPLNSAAGTYTIQLVSITDSKGCTRTASMVSVNIIVTAKPDVTASTASATICEGSSTTLNASGAANYTWSPATGLSATTGNNITANPITNNIYQVIGVTNGCADTTTISITVIPRPAKPVVITPVEYCLNASPTALNATAIAGHNLTWYNNPSLTGGSATAPTPSTATAGTYTYYVTQTNSNNCVSDASIITVSVRPLPAVDFDLPAGVCMPNGTASFINRTTIPGNGVVNYTWDFGDNSAAVTTKDATHAYAASRSYNITLTATSAFGCTASRTKPFSAFFDKPIAYFVTNRPELCQGQESRFIDQSNPSGSTITNWWWSFGDGSSPRSAQSPNYRYSKADTFTVKLVVTTAIGCVSDTFRQDVVVHLQPRIDAGPSFVVPVGTAIQFKATANDTTTTTLSWTPPFGLSNPNTLNPALIVTENRTYTLVAVGNGNCTATDTMTVRILKPIEVPNAFSPNGDGTNDTWLIPNLADYPGAKVEVFNRWGQQVFLSYGYNKPWDGTFLGKGLPLATYYYVITLNNGFKPVTGSVTIIK